MAPTKKTPKTKAKTKTTASAPSPETTTAASGMMALGGWALACVFAGLMVGVFLSDARWADQFNSDESMLVIGNKTWMPVGGPPVSVVVLSDENCGTACDTTAQIDSLRASVTPALKIENVDINSARGEALVEAFDLVSIPQYFFGTDIEDFMVEDAEGNDVKFVDNLPASILTLKENLYHIDGAQVGFKPGKFITPPTFANIDTEPTLGNGPVQVVEFTDLQCPYCKRFYDQNKTLIEQLIADGTITYTVKDFPLSFHTEAYQGMHQAANCVMQEGGADAYFAVKDQIFANQSGFNGIGPAAAMQQIAGYATEQGVNIEACLANDMAAIQAEVQADIAEGSRYGVTGTPSVFVGTQILPGAVGPATLGAAVSAEAAR